MPILVRLDEDQVDMPSCSAVRIEELVEEQLSEGSRVSARSGRDRTHSHTTNSKLRLLRFCSLS